MEDRGRRRSRRRRACGSSRPSSARPRRAARATIAPALVWRVACDIGANPTDPGPRLSRPLTRPDGREAPGRVGPALLRQRRRAQPDRGRAADVAEAVAGTEAAAVVAAGDEHRAPAIASPPRGTGSRPACRGAASAPPRPRTRPLRRSVWPVSQRRGARAQGDAAADPQRRAATAAAGVEPRRRRRKATAIRRDGPGARRELEAAVLAGHDRQRPLVGASAPREGRADDPQRAAGEAGAVGAGQAAAEHRAGAANGTVSASPRRALPAAAGRRGASSPARRRRGRSGAAPLGARPAAAPCARPSRCRRRGGWSVACCRRRRRRRPGRRRCRARALGQSGDERAPRRSPCPAASFVGSSVHCSAPRRR